VLTLAHDAKHTALADELELAHSSLKATAYNHSHRPISYTVIPIIGSHWPVRYAVGYCTRLSCGPA